MVVLYGTKIVVFFLKAGNLVQNKSLLNAINAKNPNRTNQNLEYLKATDSQDDYRIS